MNRHMSSYQARPKLGQRLTTELSSIFSEHWADSGINIRIGYKVNHKHTQQCFWDGHTDIGQPYRQPTRNEDHSDDE